jgi:bifunctional N-acetylglucosamine-1-phosphate-uridyltransferase/glucosamine-1-phosphate-acetyltransferase GlmU-like protein
MHDKSSEVQNKPILIIPAAGKSSRFQNMKPKWMLTHPSGKLMIEKVVDGLNIEDYSMVYFVILEEHCQKYEADLILEQCFSKIPYKIVVLKTATNSSPETVYSCIINEKISDSIVIKDCDCLVSFNVPKHSNFVVGMNINTSIKNIQQKSFILFNQDNIIQEIIEKKVVSDKICLGVYMVCYLECYSGQHVIERYDLGSIATFPAGIDLFQSLAEQSLSHHFLWSQFP